MPKPKFDVFLSHSHTDAVFVKKLGERLIDEGVLASGDKKLKPFLDIWNIAPGRPFQRALDEGLESTGSCAICLGKDEMDGWFQKECEVALNRQANDSDFPVIPILLPGSDKDLVPKFLAVNSWIDLRDNDPTGEMFYRLVCGIRRREPGRYKPKSGAAQPVERQRQWVVEYFGSLKKLEEEGVITRQEAEKQRRVALREHFKSFREETIHG